MAYTAEAVRAEITAHVKSTVDASPGPTVKARLRAAARALGLPVGRVADYHYGEVRRVEAHEADQIRQRARAAKERELARLAAQYQALRAELVAEAPRGLGWLVPAEIGSVNTAAGEGHDG